MALEITKTPVGLGLLTPETTLENATTLNNAFIRLEPRVRNTKFVGEFNSLYNGWLTYYNKLRNNLIARLTEYGEIETWTQKFNVLRDKVEAAGVDTSGVPVVVAGKTPGVIPGKVEIEPTKKAGEQISLIRGLLTFIVTAAVAWGAVWYFSRREAGMRGFAGVRNVTIRYLEKLIEENNRNYGTNFSLGRAYGNFELWANGHRLEAGSKKDVYEAFVKYRFSDKYRSRSKNK